MCCKKSHIFAMSDCQSIIRFCNYFTIFFVIYFLVSQKYVILHLILRCLSKKSRTFAGAWIETFETAKLAKEKGCRTFAGAWIETAISRAHQGRSTVAPLRVRGLKLVFLRHHPEPRRRRTFAGAWIETQYNEHRPVPVRSRTFAGAWIETSS